MRERTKEREREKEKKETMEKLSHEWDAQNLGCLSKQQRSVTQKLMHGKEELRTRSLRDVNFPPDWFTGGLRMLCLVFLLKRFTTLSYLLLLHHHHHFPPPESFTGKASKIITRRERKKEKKKTRRKTSTQPPLDADAVSTNETELFLKQKFHRKKALYAICRHVDATSLLYTLE